MSRKIKRTPAGLARFVVQENTRCTKKADRAKKGVGDAWDAAWIRVFQQCMFPSGHPAIPGIRKRRPRARK